MLIKMKESKGFTLVELMIVVAIIGILAAVAVPYYQRYVAKSRLSSLVFPAVHAIENAISTKYAVQGIIPGDIAQEAVTAGALASSATSMTAMSSDANLKYIANLEWKDRELIVGIDRTATEFKALFAATLRARANEGDSTTGTLYWTYTGTLARELGF